MASNGSAQASPRGLRTSNSIPNFSRLRPDSVPAGGPGAPSYSALKPIIQQFGVKAEDLFDDDRPLAFYPTVRTGRNTWPKVREDRHGHYAFESPPMLIRTPWEVERVRRRASVLRRGTTAPTKVLPKRVFEELPREIYKCILEQVQASHTTSEATNVAGQQRDLRNLCLVNKRWHHYAREHLFRELWLPSNKDRPKRKLSFLGPKSALQRLARTLKNGSGLASLVRNIHVTAALASEIDSELMTDREKKNLWAIVASIVVYCANVETFTGYIPLLTDGSSTQLAKALASCANLRSHAWDLRACDLDSNMIPGFGPRALVDCHDQWHMLETLVICSSPANSLGPGTVSSILLRLPSLRHLMLQHLSRQDFHNGSLMALPPLKSLRLEHLEGITDQGIEQLAYTRQSSTLERLSLIALELTSLRTIHMLLGHLVRLKHFAFAQQTSPEPLPSTAYSRAIFDLSSQTLRTLHWSPSLIDGTATSHLAHSIAEGRMPQLRRIKAPTDHDGLLQALCRPLASERLTPDDRAFLHHAEADHPATDEEGTALRLAQLQAQLRIRSQRAQPIFSVVVEDFDNISMSDPSTPPALPDIPELPCVYELEALEMHSSRELEHIELLPESTGHSPPESPKVDSVRSDSVKSTKSTGSPTVQFTHVIGSFLGSLQSKIEYVLDEDVPGSGRALAVLDDVAAPSRSSVIAKGVRERKMSLDVLFG